MQCLIRTIQNHAKNERICSKNPVFRHYIRAAFQQPKRETLPFQNFPQREPGKKK